MSDEHQQACPCGLCTRTRDAEARATALAEEVGRLLTAVKSADALADWVGWWLSARREEEKSKFTEMRARLDAYRAARALLSQEPAPQLADHPWTGGTRSIPPLCWKGCGFSREQHPAVAPQLGDAEAVRRIDMPNGSMAHDYHCHCEQYRHVGICHTDHREAVGRGEGEA